MTLTRSYREYYREIGLPDEIAGQYSRYVRQMERAGLPPIFEFNHLALLLGRTREYLASAVNAPEYHYRQFEIKKRQGGRRKISSPLPALYECQRWIYEAILSNVRVHSSAHGFAKNKSILTNARIHKDCDYLLKIDIKDFFPSITKDDVFSIFYVLGYPQNVSAYLASLCCLEGELPQGSPCSPILSNIRCRRLDARLSALAKVMGLRYTRYADDMAFSGPYISDKTFTIFREVIEDEGFVVNEKKSKIIASKRKVVTGLCVQNGRVFLPKKYKRRLRQECHHIMAHGYYSHTSKRKIRDPFYLDRLLGRLSFWQSVEPEAKFPPKAIPILRQIKEDFGILDLGSL